MNVKMRRAKLFDRRPIPLTTGSVLVASDVLLHRLERSTLDALRRVLELGLVPSSLDFAGGDDEPFAILRFTRPHAGEARGSAKHR